AGRGRRRAGPPPAPGRPPGARRPAVQRGAQAVEVGPLVRRPALVLLSAERDRALTPAVFFKPEAVPALTGDDGQILWHNVQPQHFRSTTFFQYKSVLKHAGILAPHALGGSSAKGYNPDTDLWELTAEARG
ncbi:MAG: hypothetical protein HGA45_41605, partial [Chloroflexales bacterium]|nr:hypothetical protein [Chloroflexales bacterium]